MIRLVCSTPVCGYSSSPSTDCDRRPLRHPPPPPVCQQTVAAQDVQPMVCVRPVVRFGNPHYVRQTAYFGTYFLLRHVARACDPLQLGEGGRLSRGKLDLPKFLVSKFFFLNNFRRHALHLVCVGGGLGNRLKGPYLSGVAMDRGPRLSTAIHWPPPPTAAGHHTSVMTCGMDLWFDVPCRRCGICALRCASHAHCICRRRAGTRNLIAKTLMDERFLLQFG